MQNMLSSLARRLSWVALLFGAALVPAMLWAADGANKALPAADPNAQTVDLFDGIRNGDLAVKLIPKDSKESRITIENKTNRPLNVKLPETFAGVPVLAQQAAAAPRNQAVGGGGGMGMGCVPPEKTESFKIPTVCLEHGKAEPRPTTPYEIRPLESVTQNAAVQEVCQELGAGKINQRVAQAAAWHLNNNMSWEQLAAKRLHHIGGNITSYFSMAEIQAAMRVSDAAVATANERSKPAPVSASSASSK
jgi:hypothetical protein